MENALCAHLHYSFGSFPTVRELGAEITMEFVSDIFFNTICLLSVRDWRHNFLEYGGVHSGSLGSHFHKRSMYFCIYSVNYCISGNSVEWYFSHRNSVHILLFS